ncbi:anti-sigma factor antagonist [Candidatus Peregrinibacteria bacterium]|nr:anti-sigma factor antagonist [Candidatus Peregrinibacteria bacterium]
MNEDYTPSITLYNKKNSAGDTIVQLEGDLDKAGLEQIKEEFEGIINNIPDGKNFIIDLTNLNFINSEGIGFLFQVHCTLSKRNVRVILIGPNKSVEDVLHVIGFHQVVDIFPDFNSIK